MMIRAASSKIDPRLAQVADQSVTLTAAWQNAVQAIVEKDGDGPTSFDALLGVSLAGISLHGDCLLASALIRFRSDAAAHRERLAKRGITLRAAAGDVASAWVELEALGELEADDEVLWVELSRPLRRPPTDASTEPQHLTWYSGLPEIGADRLHERGIAGQGVVIGVVDYYLDFYHPTFIDPETNATRVEWLWDQAPPDGRPAESQCSGRVFCRADLDADLRSGRPYSLVHHVEPFTGGGGYGHGTSVAGVAAGNGRSDGAPGYVGVGPSADLIFVSTVEGASTGNSAELVDAVAFIFERAGDRPCVINISLGDALGPRDGTSPVELFLDNTLADHPRRAVVVAAGNVLPGRSKHAAGTVEAGKMAGVCFHVPRQTRQSEIVQIWMEADAALEITLEAPGGTRIGPLKPGQRASSAVEGTFVQVTSVRRSGLNGRSFIEIDLSPEPDGVLAHGAWHVELHASGEVSVAWDGGIGASTEIRWMCGVRERGTVMTPGTARHVITVGGYHLRKPTAVGKTSAWGPTADGRRKPDLVAPGYNIGAPLAKDRRRPDPLPAYTSKAGTSIAAAHVTGALALLFQQQGDQADRDSARSAMVTQEHRSPAEDQNHMGAGKLHLSLLTGPNVQYVFALANAPGASRERDTVMEINIKSDKTSGNVTITWDAEAARAGVPGRLSAFRTLSNRQQIDVGGYNVHSLATGEPVIGHVYVVRDEMTGAMYEHWALRPDYVMPSEDNTSVSMRFAYTTAWDDLERFQEEMAEISGVTYIVATCEEQSLPVRRRSAAVSPAAPAQTSPPTRAPR